MGPKPDNVARCGGPGICEKCSREALQGMKETENYSTEDPTVETEIYTRKPFEVEAIQVTEDNIDHVREWCQGTLMADNRPYIKVRVTRPLNERQTKAYPGDWVLYAGTGFKVYTDRAFHKTFEKQPVQITGEPKINLPENPTKETATNENDD